MIKKYVIRGNYPLQIESDDIEAAERCLIDNGIAEDEAAVVLQAIGYILLNVELYPENQGSIDFGGASAYE